MRILTSQIEISTINTSPHGITPHNTTQSTSSSLMRKPDELFYSLEEVVSDHSARPPPSSSSSSSSSFPTTGHPSSSSSSSSSSSFGHPTDSSSLPSPSPPYAPSSSSSSSSSSTPTGITHSTHTLRTPQPDISSLLISLLSLAPSLWSSEETLRRASAVSHTYLSTSSSSSFPFPPSSSSTSSSSSSSTTSSHMTGRDHTGFRPTIQGITGSNNGHLNFPFPAAISDQPILANQEQENNRINGEEKNYRINNEEEMNKLYGMMGAVLDRTGCAVMLLILYILVDHSLIKIKRDVSGDLHDICTNSFLVCVADGLRTNAMACGEYLKDLGLNTHEDFNTRNCIVFLYEIFEKQTLAAQDVTLATAGFRLLYSLSDACCLSKRRASVAWILLQTLHTQHTALSTHLLSEDDDDIIPGTDGIWPYLAAYVSPLHSPSLDQSYLEIQNGGHRGFFANSGGKAVFVTVLAFKNALGFSGGNVGGKTRDLTFCENSVSFFRMTWISWWCAETPGNRVYGVLSLLLEIFRCHLLPPSEDESSSSHGDLIKGKGSKVSKIGTPTPGLAGTGGSYARARASYSTPVPSPDPTPFHSLTSESLDSLFALALGMFPALFLLTPPQSFESPSLGVGPGVRAGVGTDLIGVDPGPYKEFVEVVKSFVWLLQQLEEVLEEGLQLQFILCISIYCSKICRAVLVCVDGAVQGAVSWRSMQTLPDREARHARNERNVRNGENARDERDAGGGRNINVNVNSVRNGDNIGSREGSIGPARKGEKSNINENSDDDSVSCSSNEKNESSCDGVDTISDSAGPTVIPFNPSITSESYINTENNGFERDIGSVEYLAVMLDWCQCLAHRVIRYSEVLKVRMLHTHSGLSVPRELSRATPQLQFAAERQAARILRTAKAHSLQLKDPEEIFSAMCNIAKNGQNTTVTNEKRNDVTAVPEAVGGLNKKRQRKEDLIVKWDDEMKKKTFSFSLAHKKCLKTPPDASLWSSGISDPRSMNSDLPPGMRGPRSSSTSWTLGLDDTNKRGGEDEEEEEERRESLGMDDGDEEYSTESEEEEEEEEGGGFLVRPRKGQSSPGWGLYTYNDESEDEAQVEMEVGGIEQKVQRGQEKIEEIEGEEGTVSMAEENPAGGGGQGWGPDHPNIAAQADTHSPSLSSLSLPSLSLPPSLPSALKSSQKNLLKNRSSDRITPHKISELNHPIQPLSDSIKRNEILERIPPISKVQVPSPGRVGHRGRGAGRGASARDSMQFLSRPSPSIPSPSQP